MKKIGSVFVIITMSLYTQAQLGKKVKQAAKQTTESKAQQETSEVVNSGLDKSIDAVKGIFKKKNKGNKELKAEGRTSAGGNEGNENMASASNGDTTDTSFGVYHNFTFVPGNKVIFYDDFSKDASGDFPANWETGRLR